MFIKDIIDQQVWNSFFSNNGSCSFLQSWEWGELEKSQGHQVYRLGIYDKDLATIALVIRIISKRGRFLLVPHGPIFKIRNPKSEIQKYLAKLKDWLIELAKKENCSFIRIAPILNNIEENKKIFADLGFQTAPIYMHAETTWVLPLDRSEEELLSTMRKTTRYLIKKATKDNVVIEKRTDCQGPEDVYHQAGKIRSFFPGVYSPRIHCL
jgi:lipid II:glycine glycyltransferase (peptidoglycan interpeptide bridge formation enzyme)